MAISLLKLTVQFLFLTAIHMAKEWPHLPQARQKRRRGKAGERVDRGNSRIKVRLKGWMAAWGIQWWEVMEWGKRWMEVSMESERKMNGGHKEWKSERWEWEVICPFLSCPLCVSQPKGWCWLCLWTYQRKIGDFQHKNQLKKIKKCFITRPANVLFKCSGRYFAPRLPFANKLNDDDLQHIKLTTGLKNDCYEMFSTVLRQQDCMIARHVHKILGMTGWKQNCFEWLLDAALTCCLCVNSSYQSGVSRIHKRVKR